MKLLISALTKFLAGLVLVGVLLFLPAGTFRFPGAWRFICLLFGPMILLGTVLLVRSPALLEKRLSAREKENAQKTVVGLSALMFIGGFVLAGLDFRFGWSRMPGWVSTTASIVLLLSYGLYAEVMRENAYLSRVIEVQENQTVVDTGLYAVVRHPMYAITCLLFLSIPVVLGSWWALILFLPYPALMAARIKNEEAILEAQLPGYRAYTQKVRFRMIPFIW